jgi:hypothetical protein
MKADVNRDLCVQLLHADSEAEVIALLRRAGYWDEPACWRFYGDRSKNWGTVGNQQSRAEQALIEKVMNSIDTKLIAAARMRGLALTGPDAPQSVSEACEMLFGEQLQDMEELSKSITVAATGKKSRPSVTIVDDGEGQTPSAMPRTILSLLEGNKDAIPFVQGKFNMGGSGVLEFCGVDHNVELVISRRNPALLSENAEPAERQWSFTVIRREDPGPGSPRASRFTYLAPGPVDTDGHRSLLTFSAPTFPLFPHQNQPYAREGGWGTLFKLYEYAVRATTNMMMEGGLMPRMRVLLPEPALPIRFHECRDYAGGKGSYDTMMAGLIHTLEASRKNEARRNSKLPPNVEWFDKFDLDIDGERFSARIYLFRKRAPEESKNPATTYRKDEGVIFSYNGQCQAFFSKDFFRRGSVRQDYLWDSLLVFVDCSAISVRAHEKLFMPNREHLRHGDLKFRLEAELEQKLKEHKELAQIAQQRRRAELSDNPEVSKSFEQFVQDMVNKHPLLQEILGPGFRISNPHKPLAVEAAEKTYQGKRFPTKFHFRDREPGASIQRDANINSQVRMSFVTDAENDYFRRDEQPGEIALFEVMGDELVPAKNWRTPNLFEGTATLSLSLPPSASVGHEVTYEAVVTDPSQIEPFRNRFTLTVKPEREDQPRPPRPPNPKPDQPAENPGKEAQQDTRLNVPTPVEVWEKAWADHEPPFDKFTAMRVKRQPTLAGEPVAFDYFINMSNVFIEKAVKERPRRAFEIRNRYKFGMTFITLALIKQDAEMRKKLAASKPNDDEDMKQPQDLGERIDEVTSAIAPFLLPLVESLSRVTKEATEREPLSEIAGEVG